MHSERSEQIFGLLKLIAVGGTTAVVVDAIKGIAQWLM